MDYLGKLDFGEHKEVSITFQVQNPTTHIWSNADPTTVTHEVETPDGVKTTYTYGTSSEIVRDAVGVYHHGLTFQQAKTWKGRWYGSGAVIVPSNWYLTVDPNPLNP